MSTTLPVATAAAGAASFAVTPVITALLARRGVVDTSNERSSHSGNVPRGGGFALLSGIAVGCFVAPIVGQDADSAGVLAGALALAAIGAIDDLRGGLGATTRLAGAALVGLAATTLVLLPASGLNLAGVVLGAVWVVAFTNAFNFMDGINGISSLHGIVFGLFAAFLAADLGERPLMVIGLCVAAASAGFLPWNIAGRIFLGDVGSYALGGVVGLLAIALIDAGAPADAFAGVLLPYLADTGLTILRRWRAGESLLQPHRRHAYQQLSVTIGKHPPTAALVAAVSAASGALTVWGSTLHGASRVAPALGALVLSGGYATSPQFLPVEGDARASVADSLASEMPSCE